MSDVAVSVRGVSKKFHRGQVHNSLRDLIPAVAKRLTRRGLRDSDLVEGDFWALRDISFEIRRGESVAVIGPNGAGKSTLLRILSRILRPTRGVYQVTGRLGALIEITAGFHPDLTGRENIYLNGAILGLKRSEIEARLDSIVDFSGVSSFIDTPVKKYSSGMQARLGFSVASHLSPDVLLVDEVLSVGDMSFQNRCIERMKQQVAAGVAVVFVSHNLQAVATLCKRCIVLTRGEVVYDGTPEEALDRYLAGARAADSVGHSGSASFRLTSVEFTDAQGRDARRLRPHAECVLKAKFLCLTDAPPFVIGLAIERTRDLLYCYGVSTEELGEPLLRVDPGTEFEVSFRFRAHFARGHYRMTLNVRDPRRGQFLLDPDTVANFTIQEDITFDGVVDIEAVARLRALAPSSSGRNETVTADPE
jgi:homopolymeric O-antigen transport system ATP-binding protein